LIGPKAASKKTKLLALILGFANMVQWLLLGAGIFGAGSSLLAHALVAILAFLLPWCGVHLIALIWRLIMRQFGASTDAEETEPLEDSPG
jgi:hypothetical protein